MSGALETALVKSGMTVTVGSNASAGTADSNAVVVHITVQRAGARARAQVRLSKGSNDAAMWADQVDFPAGDSFAAQDSIAARVTRILRDSTAARAGS